MEGSGAIYAGGVYSDLVLDTSKFYSQLEKAGQQMNDFGNKLKASSDKMDISKKFEKIGKGLEKAGKELTTKVTMPLLGIGIAASKVGFDFEAKMSRVKAISGATGESFRKLERQAMDLGAQTAFSAKQHWHTTGKLVA